MDIPSGVSAFEVINTDSDSQFQVTYFKVFTIDISDLDLSNEYFRVNKNRISSRNPPIFYFSFILIMAESFTLLSTRLSPLLSDLLSRHATVSYSNM